MSDVSDVRKEILNEVFKASEARKISWVFEEGDDSAQAYLPDFQIHFDEKPAPSGKYYKVWILNNEGDIIDDYVVRSTTSGSPLSETYSTFFDGISSIYKAAKEQKKMSELDPILQKLRGL